MLVNMIPETRRYRCQKCGKRFTGTQTCTTASNGSGEGGMMVDLPMIELSRNSKLTEKMGLQHPCTGPIMCCPACGSRDVLPVRLG